MSRIEHWEAVRQQIDAWLEDLYRRAMEVVERHWALVRDAERNLPWEQRSCLQLRCAKRGNAILLEWTQIKWIGSKAKGNRRMVRIGIRKTEEYGYSLKNLLALSKDWERPLVEETETRLTELRREARHINKALRLLKIASGTTGARNDGKDEEE